MRKLLFFILFTFFGLKTYSQESSYTVGTEKKINILKTTTAAKRLDNINNDSVITSEKKETKIKLNQNKKRIQYKESDYPIDLPLTKQLK